MSFPRPLGRKIGRALGVPPRAGAAAAGFNIGDVRFSESAPDDGVWLPCDGSLQKQATYPDLFALLGKRAPLSWEKTSAPLANPATLPTGDVHGVRFSQNSNYLACAHTTTPFLTVYSVDGVTLTKIADPVDLPAGGCNSCSWSTDNTLLAVGISVAPYIIIYEWDEDTETLTKLADPTDLPTGLGNGIQFSHDPESKYLTVAHNTAPYMTVYERDGTSFTKKTGITNPGASGLSVDFAYNGKHMAVGSQNNPYLNIYSIDDAGDFTKLATPSNANTSDTKTVRFSRNSRWLFTGQDVATYWRGFQIDGDTFTADVSTSGKFPSGPTGGIGAGVTSGTDNILMADNATATDNDRLFGDEFTDESATSSASSNIWSAALSPNDEYWALGITASPFIQVWRNTEEKYDLANDFLLPDMADYANITNIVPRIKASD